MPPKKKFKVGPGQKKLSDLFKKDVFTGDADETSRAKNETTRTCTATASMAATEDRKFQSKWVKLWPWLLYNNGSMFCNQCISIGKKNTFTVGCQTFKTSSMVRHEATLDHKQAINSTAMKADMDTAMQTANSENDEAVIKLLKCVNWMARENIPLSKYESFINFLVTDLGVKGLNALEINSRVDYKSYYAANELLEAMSDVVDDQVNEKIQESPFVTLYADESTDIANKKRMTLTATIINPTTSVPSYVYLKDIEYEDSTGQGLASEIRKEIDNRNINYRKILGFGSDGATVMTGKGKGVAGRLKENINPHMVNIHCMAHRLALCTEQSAEKVPLIRKFKDWMTNLYYYFKGSASREKELHKIQNVLNSPNLKYKEVHAVRWLSFYDGLEAVYRTLDPLITYLNNRNFESQKDPKAKGLLKLLASQEFLFIIHLMMDVIPIVSKLCLQFQKENLDVAMAKVSLDLCLGDLDKYKSGTASVPTFLDDLKREMKEVDTHLEFKGHRISTYQGNLETVKTQFLDKLISNIHSRFPQKSMIDCFYVLAMRTINMVSSVDDYGNEEVDELLAYYGEQQVHKDTSSPPILSKELAKVQWQTAKSIVKSAKYPVDSMHNLWEVLTQHHEDELREIIKLAQIGISLPLHTAGCERVFSQQNIIVSKLRSRLDPKICDRLLRLRLEQQSITPGLWRKYLERWHKNKKRLLKNKK